MCGIAGIVQLDRSAPNAVIVQRMAEALAHRGPDGSGHFVDGPVAFGHRRLAVIDPTPAGHQPMMSADGRFVLSYNGELYNFQELRIELETLGFRFHSYTDSEVVLNAFAAWGEDCVHRFNGMFAFSVWDRRSQTLTLARDRYGIKPLYYGTFGKAFLFGSEVKALMRHPDFGCAMDPEALIEYFTFQNFFTDRTLFKGVRLLPAGSVLHLRPQESPEPTVYAYWDYDFRSAEPAGYEDEWLEELDRLFVQAVRRHLVSDVPVGAYLSGGMDSGSITAIAARNRGHLTTFTVGFDLTACSGVEISFDERQNAEAMSSAFQTEHYEMVLKAGDMQRILPTLVWHLEEPRVGQCYPNYYAAQLASKFCKVTLAGTGGDELFAGYPWRYYRAVVNNDFDHYIDKYYEFWQRLISNRDMQRAFAPIWDQVKHVSTRDIFRDVFATHAATLIEPQEYVNHSLYFEARTFLHGLLVVDDKLSMAHGLETRTPFLDNDLVDFALRCPVSLKLGNLTDVVGLNENEAGPKIEKYFNKTRDGKLILRRAMERHIPDEATKRIKQGFSGPDATWFKGQSIEFLRHRLLNGQAPIYDFLDRETMASMVEEHLRGERNRRLLIWSLLCVDEWCRQFLA